MRLTTFLPENLLKWCIQADYVNSCNRLTRLLDQAQEFRAACKGWASVSLPFDDALDLALAVDQPEAGRAIFGADFSGYVGAGELYQLALGVVHIAGKSIHSILQPIFNSHPGVPTEFKVPEHVTVLALNQLDAAMTHGAECKNCIAKLEYVVRYVAEGTALYGVRSTNGHVGTIALCCDRSELHRLVEVQEVSGVENKAAEFELCYLAQQLAVACNAPRQHEKWIAYESACALWRDVVM
jgi:hypothetical protein